MNPKMVKQSRISIMNNAKQSCLWLNLVNFLGDGFLADGPTPSRQFLNSTCWILEVVEVVFLGFGDGCCMGDVVVWINTSSSRSSSSSESKWIKCGFLFKFTDGIIVVNFNFTQKKIIFFLASTNNKQQFWWLVVQVYSLYSDGQLGQFLPGVFVYDYPGWNPWDTLCKNCPDDEGERLLLFKKVYTR